MPYTFPVGTTAPQKARAVNAVCSTYGYKGDGSNASKMAFFNEQVVAFIRGVTRASEAATAGAAARAAAAAAVDADLAGLS